MKNPYLVMAKQVMNNFSEEDRMRKPDFNPMSEVTPLNEFSVEMLGALKVAVDWTMGNNPIRNYFLPKWNQIIKDALRDARERENKLPY